MTDTNTGGPAFPLADSCCEYGNTNRSDANGMTLRDYFAASAMQAAISRGNDTNRPGIAEWAYCMADAMLKARTQ